MFTREELEVIKEALAVADREYMEAINSSKGNKNKAVSANRKQKKLWLVQNKLNKIIANEK